MLVSHKDFQCTGYHLVNGPLRISAKFISNTVRDDGADRQAVVAEMLAECIEAGCFHLEIGDTVMLMPESMQQTDDV